MTALATDRLVPSPPARFAAARERCATRCDASEPATERGWFESSRELHAGLTVIELDAAEAARTAPWAVLRLQ